MLLIILFLTCLLDPNQIQPPSSFQVFTAEWERGKFKVFIFRVVTVLQNRNNEIFKPCSLNVGHHRPLNFTQRFLHFVQGLDDTLWEATKHQVMQEPSQLWAYKPNR